MYKILIIEDNQDIRENIGEILDLAGYTPLMAENGKVGVRMAIDERPDLILCDIMMPELDGYGVLHILSKNEETLSTPFIFLTAKAEKSDVRRGMNLGADDYITKPFEESDLLSTIDNRLKKREVIGRSSDPEKHTQDLFEHKLNKTFKFKELIYRQGDSSVYAYFIKSGKIKLNKMNKDGKEVVVELCSSGDFFGYWPILDGSNHSNTAECLEDAEVWFIPADDFKQMIGESSELSSHFIKLLTRNLLIKEHKILDLAYESVRKRIAKALIELKDTYGTEGTFKMKVSRETIASMAGTSVETAIRMLSEFKADGLIEVNGSEIKIVDDQKLSRMPY